MTHAAKTTETTKTFSQSARPPIPEYIYVYNHTGDHVEVKFENVTIKTPDGDVLIEDINFTLNDSERAGFTGPNGGGKSSIFRTMGELTSYGKGRIHIKLPEGKRMMNVSQEMRKAPTTLPGMMSYPNDPSTYTHTEYESCLEEAGLPQLKVQLPWNAAKPDTLFPMYKAALDSEINKYTKNVSVDAAEKMKAALIDALSKAEIEVPRTIADYFTSEHQISLKQKIIDYAREKFDSIAEEQEGKSTLFPGHTGRKIARNALSGGSNSIQNWIFMGHKMPLSGGQAEQLGFARLFLQANEVALFLLDEVTSALKEDKADELYTKLFSKAKGATAIGIIHNAALLKHYTHHLELGTDKRMELRDIAATGQSGSKPPDITPKDSTPQP